MNPNTCFHSMLALNNLGVSLAKRNCLDEAIQVFVDTLNLFGEDMAPDQAYLLLSKANQFLTYRQQELAGSSIDRVSCSHPITFVSADMLVRHTRAQFRDDFDCERETRKIPHALHLIYFTESIDFSERGAWEAVVAIIFCNLGTAHFAISSTKEEKVNNALIAAHYLWEYSVFLCEKVIYDDPDVSADWITMARCLVLLLCPCLQDTSRTLNLEEEDGFFGSFAEESACLWENESFRKMPYSQTVADAA